MTYSLAILLSTCNGERFLAEQLDSLLRQTRQDFIVVARDDGSSDGSRAVLEAYAARHPDRFHLLPRDSVNRGACASFALLMETVLERGPELGLESAWMMFCDQDDIWLEDKIERQTKLMRETEAGDPSLPVLVHSDLKVVSFDNQPVAPSFAAFQGLDVRRNRFTEMAVSNLVTGCTALINEALARRALPMSADAIMHDWWLALTASAFGKVAYMEQPTVRYRQHDANTIGARRHTAAKLTRWSHWRRLIAEGPNLHLIEVGRQARAFLGRHRESLSPAQRRGLWLCSLLRVRVGLLQRFIYRMARNLGENSGKVTNSARRSPTL